MRGGLIIIIIFYLTVKYVAFLPLPVLVQKRREIHDWSQGFCFICSLCTTERDQKEKYLSFRNRVNMKSFCSVTFRAVNHGLIGFFVRFFFFFNFYTSI